MLMKKYALAIAIASGALFSLSAQAAPVTSAVSGLQGQVTGEVQKVHHCRWSSGYGCGGGFYYYGGHSRYWSHRRWGSGGYGYYGHGRYWSHRRWGSRGW
jgi:hypothetical protein